MAPGPDGATHWGGTRSSGLTQIINLPSCEGVVSSVARFHHGNKKPRLWKHWEKYSFFFLIKDVLLSLHHRNKVKLYLNLNIKCSCINKTDQTTKSMQKLNSSQSDSGWGCDRTLTGRYSQQKNEQRVTDNEPTPVWRHGCFFCFCCWNVHTHHKLPASTWDDRLNHSDNLVAPFAASYSWNN